MIDSVVNLQGDHFRPPIANEIECEVAADRISSHVDENTAGVVPPDSGSRVETPFQQSRRKTFGEKVYQGIEMLSKPL